LLPRRHDRRNRTRRTRCDPEATEAVCDKILDGFGEQMRAVSLNVVPTAILSRQIAGTRGSSLIVNMPGKPAAIHDCLLASSRRSPTAST
jgi:molybdopterin biosynthesis enzyme MoaB